MSHRRWLTALSLTVIVMLEGSRAAAQIADQPLPAAPEVEPATAPGPSPDSRALAVEQPRSVAVLDLRSTEATEAIARALTVVVTSEVAATRGYRVISRNDLRTMLTHQTDGQLLGCTDVRCMADIGRLAAADLIVAGGVERLEEALVFSLELIDPTVPRVVERQTATWRDGPDRMVELARPYVDRLLSGSRAQTFHGDLEVIAPAGASVTIDGNASGIAPLAHPVTGLSTGVHRIEAHLAGYVPGGMDVVVVRGETALARIAMVTEESRRPWYGRWWVWGSIGGGLALLGGTGIAVAIASTLNNPKPTGLSFTAPFPTN